MPKISLKFIDRPLGEILDELNRQSGLKLEFRTADHPVDLLQTLSFAIQDMPLWDAVQVLQQRVQGQLALPGGEPIPSSMPAPEYIAPQSIQTPLYMINPGYLNRTLEVSRDFSTDEVTRKEAFSFSGTMIMDPRLRLVSGTKIHLEEATDDKGGSLLGDETDFANYFPSSSQNYLQLQVGLKSRPDMGGKISRLKGVVTTLLALKSETWEINDPRNAAGTKKTVHTNVGDLTFSLDSIKKFGDQLNFFFLMTGPALSATTEMQAPSLSNNFRAYNADGKLVNTGMSSGDNSPEQHTISFNFDTNNPSQLPAKFVLTLPLEVRRLEMPFELKDIPMPPTEPTAPSAVSGETPQRDETPALTVEDALKQAKGPRLITLHFKDTGAEKVVAEMTRQSGIPIAFNNEQPTPVPTISIDIDKQPFWAAMRSLMGACKLRYVYGIRNRTITLYEDPSGANSVGQWQGLMGASGLVRVRALQSKRTLEASLGLAPQQGNARQSLKLSCWFDLDPQLQGLPYTNELRLEKVVDDKGNSLRLAAIAEREAHPSNSNSADLGFWQEFTLQPKQSSLRIAQLKGAMRLETAIRTELWEIPDALNAKALSRALKLTWRGKTYDQNYTIDNFTMDEEEFKFTLHIVNQFEETPPQYGYIVRRKQGFAQFFQNHIQLRDANGQLFPIVDIRITDQGMETIVVHIPRRVHAYTLATPGKLSLELPAEIQTVEIPFEFKGVPLP